jgi:putative oxidoreductase
MLASRSKPDDASLGRLIFPGLAPFYRVGQRAAYALLRLVFGLTMVTHGIPKLTGSAHGSMADPLQGSTHLIADVLGLPFAAQLAWCVTLLETFGGIALALGLATRFVATMFAVQAAAICIALAPTYPWIDRGIEYPLMLGFAALFIAMRGGGGWSIDAWLGREL